MKLIYFFFTLGVLLNLTFYKNNTYWNERQKI